MEYNIFETEKPSITCYIESKHEVINFFDSDVLDLYFVIDKIKFLKPIIGILQDKVHCNNNGISFNGLYEIHKVTWESVINEGGHICIYNKRFICIEPIYIGKEVSIHDIYVDGFHLDRLLQSRLDTVDAIYTGGITYAHNTLNDLTIKREETTKMNNYQITSYQFGRKAGKKYIAELINMSNMFYDKRIIINEKKRSVTLVVEPFNNAFAEKEVYTVKCQPGDKFDAMAGIGLALSHYIGNEKELVSARKNLRKKDGSLDAKKYAKVVINYCKQNKIKYDIEYAVEKDVKKKTSSTK